MTAHERICTRRSSDRDAASSDAGATRVDLWWVDPAFVDDPQWWRACERLLSNDERRRLRELRVTRVRREYLVARALVRAALSRRRAVPAHSWRFVKTPHGRPEIDPPSPLSFSVSHCEGLVVCGLAEGRAIGIDAEPLSRAGAILEAAARVFTPAEVEDLAVLADPRDRRVRAATLWTLKESYVKARGVGFSVPPRSFGFRLEGAPMLQGPQDDSAQQWSWTTLRLAKHVVSVTIESRARWSLRTAGAETLLAPLDEIASTS